MQRSRKQLQYKGARQRPAPISIGKFLVRHVICKGCPYATLAPFRNGTRKHFQVPCPVGWNRLGWFVGQFQNDTGPRILTKQLLYDPVGLTNDRCKQACANAGYNLAGVENGEECWCDYRLYSAPRSHLIQFKTTDRR